MRIRKTGSIDHPSVDNSLFAYYAELVPCAHEDQDDKLQAPRPIGVQVTDQQ